MSEKNQKLVLAILDFLSGSIQDGTIKEDDKEGLEVAIQCIGEAFGVDPNDQGQRQCLSIKPATLSSLFDIFARTQSKMNASGTSPTTESSHTSSAPKSAKPSEGDKKKAEEYKKEGNALMSSKDYSGAIEVYNKAVELDPSNPVYYSNRAAAYSSKEEHERAIVDSKKALEVDPSFVKAYSRLGHAHYCLKNYTDAVEAFSNGLKLEPNNAHLKAGLENARARAPSTDEQSTSPIGGDTASGGMPDLSSLAGMFGGGGGGGGSGGMPDLSSVMNNPMFMQMAQSMMANGGLERMMQNPALANMARNFQQGGGMPNVQEMMNDPQLREVAQNFMGGAGDGR